MKSSPLGSGPNANTDDSSTERTEWVCLGVVTRPHGVRGEVRVHPFNQDSDLIGTLRSVRLRVAGAGDELSVYKVRNSRRAPKVWLLALEGVQSMESAEALRGHELCITRAEMPPPPADEYYLRDAVGLPVVREGERIGEVVEVMFYPSMECFRCRFEDGFREVPIVRPWVEGVDIEAGEVRVGDLSDLPVEKLGAT